MASKAERALVTGTDNVFNLQVYRALKLIAKHKELYPWYNFDPAPKPTMSLGECICYNPEQHGHDIQCPGYIKPNIMGHHDRMLKATAAIKARQTYLDNYCPNCGGDDGNCSSCRR